MVITFSETPKRKGAMNRREFIKIKSVAIVSAGAGIGLNTAAATNAPASEASAVGNPVLLNPDVDTVGVAWRVHQISNGMIEYGITEELGQTAVAAKYGLRKNDNAVLLVDITDLKPDTTYFYRTVTTPLDFVNSRYKHIPNRGTPHRSEIYKFRTPAIKSDTTSFAVINDTHGYKSVIHTLFDKLQKDRSDVVIWNGDISDFITPESVTDQTVDMLGPKKYATETPIAIAYGNHDVRGKYAMDMEKVIPTRGGKRYFTFQNGPIQFMVLDSGEDKPDSHRWLSGLTDFASYRSEQRQWISRQIEQEEWKKAKFRVIICHIPLFGPWNCPDGREKWHDLLVKGKADLMISGHTHQFAYHGSSAERPYPLLVGGGPKPHEATLIRGRVTGNKLDLNVEFLNGKTGGKWTLESRA